MNIYTQSVLNKKLPLTDFKLKINYTGFFSIMIRLCGSKSSDV